VKVNWKMRKPQSNRRGKQTDDILLEVVRSYPGLSQYELGKKLGWKAGHVDGSIRRLLVSKGIFLKVMERNGKQVNLVYPANQKPMDVIEVPMELLEVGNPHWSEEAVMYALDNSTIGISGSQIQEWNDVAAFRTTIPVRMQGTKILLTIPKKFITFYNLDKKAYLTGISGGNVLITIAGDIVETKAYPT
jgi:hypothetical protein